jgi:hypothetical protein
MSFEHPAGRHVLRGRFAVEDQGRHWEVGPQATPTGLIVLWTAILNGLGLMLVAHAGVFAAPETLAGWYAVGLVAVEAPLLAGGWQQMAQSRAGGGSFFRVDRVRSVVHLARDGQAVRVADVQSVELLRGWRMIGPRGNRTEAPWVELSLVTTGGGGVEQRHVLLSARRAPINDPTTRLGRQLAEDLRVPLQRRLA